MPLQTCNFRSVGLLLTTNRKFSECLFPERLVYTIVIMTKGLFSSLLVRDQDWCMEGGGGGLLFLSNPAGAKNLLQLEIFLECLFSEKLVHTTVIMTIKSGFLSFR